MATVAIVIMLLVGLVILFGSILHWDLMFRSSIARDMIQKIGIDATKLVYGGVGLALVIAAGLMILIPQFDQPLQAKPDASVLLSIESDGCTVTRTDVAGAASIQNLLWMVSDENYQTVLTRSADNEYTYRHQRSGKYGVVVQAWYEGGYVTISNRVKINCSLLTP